jgi:hypothetical protein
VRDVPHETWVADVVTLQLVDVGVRVHLREVETLDDVADATLLRASSRVISSRPD